MQVFLWIFAIIGLICTVAIIFSLIGKLWCSCVEIRCRQLLREEKHKNKLNLKND